MIARAKKNPRTSAALAISARFLSLLPAIREQARYAFRSESPERRQDLIKIVHKRGEERRIMVRNIRRDGLDDIKKLEKQKTLSQDESKRALERLQKITDGFMAKVEEIITEKEADIKEV